MIRLALALSLLATPALAQETLSGHPEVIDGDTIKLEGRTLRLDGIDAPEMAQSLGNWSRMMLQDVIRGREVVCSWDETGRFGRPLAICAPILPSERVSSISINSVMVRRGYAAAGLPYGYRFERQQSLAMKDCLGIWARVGLAWCFRRGQK